MNRFFSMGNSNSCGCQVTGSQPAAQTNNTNCSFTNTATASGYLDAVGTGNPTQVKGEDSVTLGCIFADITKTADRESVSAGDRIRYTITFKNMSDVDMYDVTITDSLPNSLTPVMTSITPPIRPGESLETGINLGRVGPGGDRTLIFTATVANDITEDIVNRAFADFTFTDISGREQTASTPITSVTTVLDKPGITVTKTADKSYVTSDGEQITFTITVNNPTSRRLQDLVVTDALPQGMSYVANSTSIGGQNPIDANPTGGIYLGILNPNSSITITFAAKVNMQ